MKALESYMFWRPSLKFSVKLDHLSENFLSLTSVAGGIPIEKGRDVRGDRFNPWGPSSSSSL